MTLLLDVGNSRLKWAWAPPAAAFSVHGAPYEGAGAWPAAWTSLAAPTAIWALASAAGRTAAVTAYCERRWQRTPRWFAACAGGHGVRNLYAPPAALGADRYAALVGARARYAVPLCVVDCGTAITIDALDAAGVFRGGAILPGLRPALAGLRGRATHLPAAELTALPQALGQSTAAALTGGLVLGTAGAIIHLLNCQAQALGVTPAVVLTGGDAPVLAPHLARPIQIADDLTLYGLWVMAR